jgi:hypothetical protein
VGCVAIATRSCCMAVDHHHVSVLTLTNRKICALENLVSSGKEGHQSPLSSAAPCAEFSCRWYASTDGANASQTCGFGVRTGDICNLEDVETNDFPTGRSRAGAAIRKACSALLRGHCPAQPDFCWRCSENVSQRTVCRQPIMWYIVTARAKRCPEGRYKIA